MKIWVLFMLCAAAFAQEDPRGWGKAHWGMTKQQLVVQLGAKSVPVDTIWSPKRESRLGLDFALEKLKFRAYFFVDEAFGLETVHLVCQDEGTTLGDFLRLERELTAKYGPPRKRKADTQKGFDANAAWVVGSTSIELVFLSVNGRAGDKVIHTKVFDITYHRVGADKL